LTINNEATNFYGTLNGMTGIQNPLSKECAFAGEKGKLCLIDPPAVRDDATEVGNNKNLAYEFTLKCIKIALVCEGYRVQN
jgi:hypothetical protein